jgi:hypothetical protein
VKVTPLDLVVHVGSILDELGVRWVLGGSLASSLVGEPRSTLDIDLAVEIDRGDVSALVARVEADFYVSEPMALEAVVHGTSFNLLHFESGLKVDIFVLTDAPLDRRQISRREAVEIESGVRIWVGASDDQILRKLSWFRAGGQISDRQWRDVLAILIVQGDRIDHTELQRAADELGLGELAARAIAEAHGPSRLPQAPQQ